MYLFFRGVARAGQGVQAPGAVIAGGARRGIFSVFMLLYKVCLGSQKETTALNTGVSF